MDGAALALGMDDLVASAVRGDAAPDSAEALDRLTFWQAATGGQVAPSLALDRRLAGDIMALRGVLPAARILARRGAMLARAASGLRALEEAAAQGLRRAATDADFDRGAVRVPFAGFFAVEDFDLIFRRFDGSMSRRVSREVLIGGDAVTVLPWDPARDRVLVVEQVRTGPMARGDANPWQLEPVAGRIDAGESPEQAARREAVEEAGLVLGRLEKVAEYYPTTSAFSEYLYSYVALCNLPDGSAGVFGLEAEAEDIRGHLVGFDDLVARMDAGELGNAPLILSVQWLWRHRDRLRAAAQGQGI